MDIYVDKNAPSISEVFFTDLGWVGVIGSSSTINKITFPYENRDAAEFSIRIFTKDILHRSKSGDIVSNTCQQISRYLDGQEVIFDQELALMGTDFQVRAWNVVRNIPLGETRSYSWIAESIGNPKAFRAIGNAMKYNPVPILIPCHRVIGKDGSMTGYGGKFGTGIKAKLLSIESNMIGMES